MSKEKIKVKLLGENANVFNLIAIVSRELKANDELIKSLEFTKRAFESKDYQEVLSLISQYVDVI